jgi:oxygen-independent coproporphyrinogen-3 oxidase
MLRELQTLSHRLDAKPKLQSIFFGGGTPSLMPGRIVEGLLNEAERIFGFAPNIEITLEANPTSVDAGRFRDYRAAGVNRVSLGVQALNDQDLRALGRLHRGCTTRTR